METITTKVLDNSFISACITDIKSHNLIDICDGCYQLISSPSVYEESKQLKGQFIDDELIDEKIIEQYYGKIEISDMSKNPKYNELLDYLQNRYPYLHKGELSTYLIALINSLNGDHYYFITDDMQFRRKIPTIKNDPIFVEKLGNEVLDLNISGTVGIVRRLYEKNLLTPGNIEEIINDLKSGSFYLTDDLIEYLRGNHEN